MSEPRRWLGADSDAPPGARELLEAAGRPGRVPEDVDRRTAARVARLAALPAAVLSTLVTWKVVAVAATVTVVTAGSAVGVPRVIQVLREKRAARERVAVPAPRRDTPPPPVIEPPRPEPASQAATPRPEPASQTATSRPRPRAGAPAKAPPADPSFTREVALLEQARGELTRRPRRTLALLRRYDAEFRHGQLALEREVIALDALQRLGRRVEARRGAQAFLARHPTSPYRTRIEEILRRLEEPPQRGGAPP